MAKRTKQILRNNNKEQKENFTQWEPNQIPKQEGSPSKSRKTPKTSMSHVI